MGADTNSYEKWRMKLMHTCLILAILAVIAELVMFFVLKATDFILISNSAYFMKYFLIPMIINFSAIGIGYIIMSSSHASDRVKEYTPVITLCIISFCMPSVHNVFPVISCTLCFPVILTATYGDLKITKNTTITCEILLILSTVYGWYQSEEKNFILLYDGVIVAIMIVAMALLTVILINYDKEKRRLLKNSFSKQGMLKEQLLHDPMTGLYNHAGFYSRLDTMTRNIRIQGALAVVDIDDFKKVNDTWGHEKGDLVLTQFAYILKSACGQKGIPARYGGEEFAVIFPGVAMQEAVEIMEDIRIKFYEHTFDFMENEKVSFSCGVALYMSGMTLQQLFNCADQAMYQAKSEGKNKVVTYCPKRQK